MGSTYGLLISVISIPLIVIRIAGEEQMLLEELEGYAEYKKNVSFKLFPKI